MNTLNISDEMLTNLKALGFEVVDRAWLEQKEKDAEEATRLRQELRVANFKIDVLNKRLNEIAEFAKNLSGVGTVINLIKETAEK